MVLIMSTNVHLKHNMMMASGDPARITVALRIRPYFHGRMEPKEGNVGLCGNSMSLPCYVC